MQNEEKGLTLYELTESMKDLKSVLENSDRPEELVEYLDAVDLQLVEKVDNIVRFTNNDELTVAAIDAEIKRLSELKMVFSNRRKRLLDYVKYVMEKFDVKKIETNFARLSFRSAKSVVVDDKELLPAEFIKVKTVAEPDKIAIKEAIESGKNVPGAHIETNQQLQVK